MKPKVDIKKIIDLRQKLHKFPELSGQEQQTVQIITHFFKRFNPDKTYNFDNGSVAFQFGNPNEKAVVFRAELDALPIDETIRLPYSSVNPGISHKCGHDGHMAILAGLAEAISKLNLDNKKVVFLFQSAEETLSGAPELLSDPNFKQIDPKLFIGFHNIPGYPFNSILVKPGDFNAYVTGIKAVLKGKSAHAAYAKENTNLLLALMRLIQFLEKEFPLLSVSKKGRINITHISYGKPTFGISPDSATIHLTLRAFSNPDLEDLIDLIEQQLKLITVTNRLKLELKYTEDAPSIFNDPQITKLAIDVAKKLDYQVIEPDKPFEWGEDFGFYTIKYKGFYFGIGAGKDTPQLHTHEYDFPDEIILPSIEFLLNLYLSLDA